MLNFIMRGGGIPPLICAIYDMSNSDSRFDENYALFLSATEGKKGLVIVNFFARTLEQEFQSGELVKIELAKNLRVNYIKCARYALIELVWEITGQSKRPCLMGKSRAYVMDFDVVVRGAFDDMVSKYFSNYSCLLSYQLKDGELKFEKDLVYSRVESGVNATTVNVHYAHKIIKAGFACFSPGQLAKLFFFYFNSYAFQSSSDVFSEPITNLLFSHYYGDQLSMLSAIREIRYGFNNLYFDQVGWINMHKSKIANLDQSLPSSLYFPKGEDDS